MTLRVVPLLIAGVLAVSGCQDTGVSSSPGPAPTASPPSSSAPSPEPASVPAGALIAARDLGTGWSSTPPVLPTCRRPPASAQRSVGLASARGRLTETLVVRVPVEASVAAWRTQLRSCGYSVSDLALGDAGLVAHAADGNTAVVVTGTEGVLVVLHAQGALARNQGELESWADLALGTSCVAAPDGCH